MHEVLSLDQTYPDKIMIMCLRNRLDPSQQQRYGRKLGRVYEVEEQVEELVDGEVLLGVLLQVVGDHVSDSGGGCRLADQRRYD